ncbi:hypothetical protein ACHWQZ_G003367 [Mnemiopsis leidyi]
MDNLNRTLLNKSQGTGTQMADSTTQTVGPNVVNLTPTDSTISLLNEPVTQPGDCKSSEVISTTNPPFSDTSSLYCPSINHSLTEEPIILSNELLFSQFSVEALIEELDFTHDIGNRKVVYFGTRPYAYNGGVHEPKDLEAHTYLAKVCNYLDIIIPNYDYNSVLVTLYANGNQFIPKHSDLEDCIEETSDIVTVSLGATRTLIITDSTSGQVIKELELKHGAVSVMTKTSQSVYKHEIIRDRECKRPRVSVTFRLIKPPIPPKQVIHKPNPCVRNLKCDSFVSSSSSGYVPFDNIAPNAPKIKPLSHINPPVLDCKTKSQLIDKHQVDNLDTKSTALFISSSMFRNLDEDKLSSGRLIVKKLFYPGANAQVMLRKLKKDINSVKNPPNNVYIMCGTNNVDKVYYGSDDLQPSMDSITELIDFVKHTFPSAKIHMQVFDFVMGTVKCSKLIDVNSKNLNKPQTTKETLVKMVLNLTEVLCESRAQLKTAASRISELSADQLANQKKVIEMQDKLIEKQSEHVEAVKATVTSEIKSFSDVVKQSLVGKMSPKALQSTIITSIEKQDRDKSLMVFGLEERDDNIPEDLVTEVWTSICPSIPIMKECYRVRKKKEGADRPIRAVFNSREAEADVPSFSSELRQNRNYRDVYVNPDRTIEERSERRKLVAILKEKISSQPDKYHYIKNGTICTADKRPDRKKQNIFDFRD